MSINTFNEKQGDLQNTGFKKLLENKIGVYRGGLLAPKGQEFATATDALTLANWTALIKDSKVDRGFVLPLFDTFEDASTDDVYAETLQGSKFKEDGKMIFNVMIDANKQLALNLRALNGREWCLYLFDESASILGTTPDDTKFKGFDVSIRVGNQKPAAQGEKMMTPIHITLKDSRQWNDEGAVLEPINDATDWNPITDLDGVYDVNLAQVGTATTSAVTVSVYKKSIASTNALADITGLVLADFVGYDSSGSVITISSVTDNGDGTYALASSAAFELNGTIDLVTCENISLTSIAIESTGAATITI